MIMLWQECALVLEAPSKGISIAESQDCVWAEGKWRLILLSANDECQI